MNPITYIVEEAALPVAITAAVIVTSFAIGRWAVEELLDYAVKKTGVL